MPRVPGIWGTSGRPYYRAWGWRENDGATDEYAAFDLGRVTLALYDIDRLKDEAARATAEAVAAGASLVEDTVEREWGGSSGSVADPEGHRWELAWARVSILDDHLPGGRSQADRETVVIRLVDSSYGDRT